MVVGAVGMPLEHSNVRAAEFAAEFGSTAVPQCLSWQLYYLSAEWGWPKGLGTGGPLSCDLEVAVAGGVPADVGGETALVRAGVLESAWYSGRATGPFTQCRRGNLWLRRTERSTVPGLGREREEC